MGAYFVLFLAILSEITGTLFLKVSVGFTKLVPTICCLFCYVLAFFFMGKSMNQIPIATAYGIWSGIGILGTLVASALLFKEPVNPYSYIGSILIILGILFLKKSQGA